MPRRGVRFQTDGFEWRRSCCVGLCPATQSNTMDGGFKNEPGDMISMKAPLVYRTRVFCSLALLGAFAVAPSALAHHSFTMFDMSKRLTLVGTVTSFEWTNPHSYIEIDVPEEQAGAN